MKHTDTDGEQFIITFVVLVVAGIAWVAKKIGEGFSSRNSEGPTFVPEIYAPETRAVQTEQPTRPELNLEISFEECMDQLAREGGGKWFPSKLVGVTKRNRPGRHRQSLLLELNDRDELWLVLEPENKTDPYAVRVENYTEEQLGYLTAHVAKEVVESMTKGVKWRCFVKDMTGDDYYDFQVTGKKPRPVAEMTCGCNIALVCDNGRGEQG